MAPTLILLVIVVTIFFQFCCSHPISGGPTNAEHSFSAAQCSPAALGMENGDIPDSSITASSTYSPPYPPSTARLNVGSNGWIPNTPTNQWIQVDLGEPTVVTGLTMQGYGTGGSTHVTAFSVQYSLTGESDDWQSIVSSAGVEIRFTLSSGRPTNVTFPDVVPVARFIRILPLSWTSTVYRVRFEVFGCQVDGAVRLVNGTDAISGRVEIYHRETRSWGAVCGEDWGLNDSTTVCRQLGLGDAVQALTASEFGRGDLPIMMNRVACDGTESRLPDCPFVCTDYQQCENSNVAGAICQPSRNTLRLRGGSNSSSGRVEIFRNHTWGTVCDHKWDAKDAGVVCRELGFTRGAEAKSGAHFGQGSGQVHMEGVTCTGSEEALGECPHLCWTASTCSHSRDAGVICSVGDFEEINVE